MPNDVQTHLNTFDHIAFVMRAIQMLQETNVDLKHKLEEQTAKCPKHSQSILDYRKECERYTKEVFELNKKFDERESVVQTIAKSFGGMDELNKKISTFEDMNLQISKLLKGFKKAEDSLKNEVDKNIGLQELIEKTNSLYTRLSVIENNTALQDGLISDLSLKLQILENTKFDGNLIWKINNIHFRIKQAEQGKIVALHSAPCFTSQGGYKFCARMYLNGDGDGLNTHVSLFFVLMRSELDALLEWPFKKRVKLQLINVVDQERSHEETFLPDVVSPSFQRPKSEINIAAGCPMFLKKEKLQTGFIVDDCLFVQITVAP